MSDSTRTLMKNLLVSRYTYLRGRLERFVGSREGAADALQETWLRLETMPEAGAIANEAYLLRMAANVAVDQIRREKHHLNLEEIDEVFEVEDELSDPERIFAARRKVDALKEVVRGLTPRRQEILRAARVDGELNTEIARRLGISLRLVEKELAFALKYCSEQMRDMLDSGASSTRGRRKF
jgi:RNA polymerase sigma factor (sigma-70 family)